MSDKKIQWHPGFVAAMDLEFAQNRRNLDYQDELSLNTMPLEIDLLVIKKNRDAQIVNEIGRLFRKYNIIEYKSPEDHMNIDTFYKSEAYACLYKAYGKAVNGRPADDITVTIIRDAKPYGLFRYFKSRKVRVVNPYPGIYYVLGEVMFRTQIVVGKELGRANHVWLRALSGKVRKQELAELLEQVKALKTKQDRELADSVLEVCVAANEDTMEELRGDESMCKALFEIMEPEINKLVDEKAEIKAEAKAKKARREAQKEIQEAQKEAQEAQKEAQEAQKEAQEAQKEAQRVIRVSVRSYRELGADNNRIQELLMRNHNLTQEEAMAYL